MGSQFEDGDDEPPSGADSVEELLRSTGRDTEAVVEALRESGPRRHVSESSVDDVLDEIATPQPEAGEAEGFALSGGPTRRISTAGIDEVFEQLEAEAGPPTVESGSPTVEETGPDAPGSDADGASGPDAAGGSGTRSDAEERARSGSRVHRSATSIPAETGERPDFAELETDDDAGFGSLAGGGPTKTVSERSVDEILDLVDEPEGDDGASPDRSDDSAGDAESLRPADPEAAMADLVSEGASALPDAAEPVAAAEATEEPVTAEGEPSDPSSAEATSSDEPADEADPIDGEPAEPAAEATESGREGAPTSDSEAEDDPLAAATKARENVHAILSGDREVGSLGTVAEDVDASRDERPIADAEASRDTVDPASDAEEPSDSVDGAEESSDPASDAEEPSDSVDGAEEPSESAGNGADGSPAATDGAAGSAVDAASAALGELEAGRRYDPEAPGPADREGIGPTTPESPSETSVDHESNAEPTTNSDAGPEANDPEERESGSDRSSSRDRSSPSGREAALGPETPAAASSADGGDGAPADPDPPEYRDAADWSPGGRPLVTRAELEEIAALASARGGAEPDADDGSTPSPADGESTVDGAARPTASDEIDRSDDEADGVTGSEPATPETETVAGSDTDGLATAEIDDPGASETEESTPSGAGGTAVPGADGGDDVAVFVPGAKSDPIHGGTPDGGADASRSGEPTERAGTDAGDPPRRDEHWRRFVARVRALVERLR